MQDRMYRAQILLEPDQHRRLAKIAQEEGRSISSVTREIIDAGLEALESETSLWNKRARIILGLRILRENQPFEYEGDLVNEARQEREDEQDLIWRDIM